MTNETPNEEWEGSITVNNIAVSKLISLLEYFLQTWPGSPARPSEEQEFARDLLYFMRKLSLEYNFACLEQKKS